KAPSRLMAAKMRLAECNQELSILEGKLGDISQKLRGVNFEDIAEREAKREELKKKLSEADRRIGIVKDNIEASQKDLANRDRELNELGEQDKQSKIFVRRRELCDDIKRNLVERLAEEENAARGVLRARIRKILEATSHKNFTLRMSDDYVISLVNAKN